MVTVTAFLNDLGRYFVDFSLAMLIQSSVLIGVLWLVDRCLRNRIRAGIRYGIWMLVLIKLILPTGFSLPTSPSYWFDRQVTDVLPAAREQVSIVPRQTLLVSMPPVSKPMPALSPDPMRHTKTAPSEAAEASPVVPVLSPEPAVPALRSLVPPPAPIALVWQAVVLLLWFTIVLAALVFLIKRILFLRALLGQCSDAGSDLNTILEECRRRIVLPDPVRLKVMPLAGSPSVCGLRRYTILIPQPLVANLDETHLRSIFLHELAHIQRGDLWINLAQTLLQILYFYHPLLWIANSVIRRAREQAVDEQVLVAMADEAAEYPQTLLHISQLAFERPTLSLRFIGVVESKRALCDRIRTIARRPFPKRAGVGLAGFAIIVLATFTLLPMAKGERKESTGVEASKSEAPKGGRIVEGIVTDPQGHPRAIAMIGNELQNPWRSDIKTDEKGRFVLQDYDPNQKSWVAYSQAAGRWGFFSLPEESDSDQSIQVGLPYEDAQLEGRVVGPDGKGISQKKVELVLITEQGHPFIWFDKEITDKYGNYTSGVPCGQGLRIFARLADAQGDEPVFQTEPLTLHDHQVLIEMPHLVLGQEKIQPDFDQNIVNDGKIRYRGRILDEQGNGLAGVKVRLRFDMPDHMSTWRKVVTTNIAGYWSSALPENHLAISMELEHPDYYLDDRIHPPQNALRDGAHSVSMKRGIAFQGSVRNTTGEPVDNVLVVARRLLSGTPSPWNQIIENGEITRTGPDGIFTIGGLSPGRRKILVIPTDHAPTIRWVELMSDMEPVQFTVDDGLSYHGQIVDSNGVPIESVTIGTDSCRFGRDDCDFSRVAYSDAQGKFTLKHLPKEASLELDVGKKGWEGFSLKLPKELSLLDKHVMYRVPVWRGKVVDAQTGEPIKDFQIANGIVWRHGEEEDWSRFHRPRKRSEDGSFSHTWEGYGVSYPFAGQCLAKVMAPGYLPAEAPRLGLGDVADALEIRLEKGEAIVGTVLTPRGDPAARAQVALVTSGKKAYLENGAFASQGYSDSADDIYRCDENGAFKLPPSRESGLIVMVHPTGYAQVLSAEFDSNTPTQLTAWARIEGSVDSGTSTQGDEIGVRLLQPEGENDAPAIHWILPRVTLADRALRGGVFSFEHLPFLPMAVGQIDRYEFNNPMFVTPKPGLTALVRFGHQGKYSVSGTIKGQGIFPVDLLNPRCTHIVAFRRDMYGRKLRMYSLHGPPETGLPLLKRTAKKNEESLLAEFLSDKGSWGSLVVFEDELKEALPESSFDWFWQDKYQVYVPSQTVRQRFIPEVSADGSFVLDGLEPGRYELVVNIHAPLGENVACGRGVLRQVGTSRFEVPESRGDFTMAAPAGSYANPNTEVGIRCDVMLKTLHYPEAGQAAPDFSVTTLDGKNIRLSDLRGKVVLLDFWATWCGPCVEKLEELQELYAKLGSEKDFVMIGLSADWDIDRWQGFLEDRDLPWAQANLGSLDESPITRDYGIGGIPTLVLIGPDGRILSKGSNTEGLYELIKQALKI